MIDSAETDPDVIRATFRDPSNVIFNVEKQTDLGLATSGANPDLSLKASGGWVGMNTNETVVVPGVYSEDSAYIQGPTGGSIGGGGYIPTGGDDPPQIGSGGYGPRHEPPDGDIPFL